MNSYFNAVVSKIVNNKMVIKLLFGNLFLLFVDEVVVSETA